MRHFPPRRIVCLTEETVETLYLLGEQDRIVGVSGYAVRARRRSGARSRGYRRSSRARHSQKSWRWSRDLVLAFSDLQAGIVADPRSLPAVAIHVFKSALQIAGIPGDDPHPWGAPGSVRPSAPINSPRAMRTRLCNDRGDTPRPGAKTKGLFRGMGRSADQRHRLGFRN